MSEQSTNGRPSGGEGQHDSSERDVASNTDQRLSDNASVWPPLSII